MISFTTSTYEERNHYVVKTFAATYYLDMAGGGFSRIIDNQGNDWVGYKNNPWGKYPESAASAFRGVPNLVHGGSDSGAGHPGHDKCSSQLIGKNKILVKSLSGLWEWQYTFFDNYVILDVLKTDQNRTYWFLYEGTPGGLYDLENSLYGTNIS